MTSAADPADKVKGLMLGAADYITKPFDSDETKARVLASLRSKELQDTLARNANVDALTGAGNRRYFDQCLSAELSRSRRSHVPLSCVLVDLDHFKSVNDTHGHPFGDRVLKEIAAILMDGARREDVVCRYGGEEFAIITPGVDLKGAAAFAERTRKAITGHKLVHDGKEITVTASFGVAEVDATILASSDLVRRADKALYHAKNKGRNRVIWIASKPAPAASQAA
jgi:diguanylate cyclase (GGDEF)-like protein